MYNSEYGTRKLAHYNAWLLNPNRPDGERYPGFPEEVIVTAARARMVAKLHVARKATPARVRAPKEIKAGTKLAQAVDIFRKLGGDKAAVIAEIQVACSMSLAGATTYFYNAKKAA
jgi:hypothetical protein